MKRQRWPKEAIVFEIKTPFFYPAARKGEVFEGTLVDASGGYGPLAIYGTTRWDCGGIYFGAHPDDLRPLTPAAREMLKLVKRAT